MTLFKFGSWFKSKPEVAVEAKPASDPLSYESGYASGFSAGFTKAWDSLEPLIRQYDDKVRQKIRNQAIEETRKQLEPLIHGNTVRQNKP